MSVWSVDPGESTGIAIWTDAGECVYREKMTPQGVMVFMLKMQPPELLVIEEWGFDPGKTQRGNKMISSKVIGMFELHAHRHDIPIVMQDRRILKVSALHTGTPIPKSGHFDDDVSAYLHGHYYFVTKGIIKPPNVIH